MLVAHCTEIFKVFILLAFQELLSKLLPRSERQCSLNLANPTLSRVHKTSTTFFHLSNTNEKEKNKSWWHLLFYTANLTQSCNF